jgi:putative DNA primase/helicase
MAGSVWGGGEPGGYVRSWRATANGLEGVALGHCDALLCLDELSQVAAHDAGEVAYMLANGSGKSRSGRDGAARRAARWRVLFLSSGEIGLADKVAEDGRRKRPAAGQQVRIVDIPADAGAGLGLFEELHGFDSPDALARHLRISSGAHFGVAARAFLDGIAGDLDGIRKAVRDHSQMFVSRHVPIGADAQVQRVAQRFALIAAGGELATVAGILPWTPGEAIEAAARCFGDWLRARGGIEAAEVRDGFAQVRSFLLAHGTARFVPAWDDTGMRVPPRDIPDTASATLKGGTTM